MTVEVKYYDTGTGAAFKASGVLTGDELLEANERVLSRAIAEKSLRYAFFDCNDLTGVSISDAQLRRVAEQGVRASKIMGNPIVVAIYAKDDIPFALSRMWMVYVEAAGWQTNVFRKKPEAIDWLKESATADSSMQEFIAAASSIG